MPAARNTIALAMCCPTATKLKSRHDGQPYKQMGPQHDMIDCFLQRCIFVSFAS